jgi:signal transduction histidine kinase
MSPGTISGLEDAVMRAVASALGRTVVGFGRALVLFALVLAGLVPLLALAVIVLVVHEAIFHALGLRNGGPTLGGIGLDLVVLILCSLLAVRRLANLTRRLASRWCGVIVTSPYRRRPAEAGPSSRLRWLATDPATWRDLVWVIVNPLAGSVLVALPIVAVLYGVMFAILPPIGVPVDHLGYVGILVVKGRGGPAIGLALAIAGLWAAPRLLPGYGSFTRALLGPNRRTELAAKVQRLVQTRTDTIDAGAAELRRIERDLHDGAQARLVAMGMTLDAIDAHLDTSPDLARALLAEAKQSSVQALSELRNLVRGIHPPVLADRGLTDAITGLALDSPLPVRVTSPMAGRTPAPVESAAYFAVSELLANVAKHAGPCAAWVDIRHSHGMLRISVGDDGQGGADIKRGTGLRGIERRLAVFDGVLAVSSPPGGPTVVNLEIPCALSSPKTSSC